MLAIGIGVAHKEDSVLEETEVFKILCPKFLKVTGSEGGH
jgi:hypothetical protein